MTGSAYQGLAARAIAVVIAIALAAVAVAVLETWTGIQDASPVFLVPVVIAAAILGTGAAVATSFAGFLLYDFLFTQPRFTLQVADPAEWVSLLLFLIVAVVIGRLTSVVRERAEEADRRAREGVALVAISRDAALAGSFADAAAAILPRLRADTEMASLWITGPGDEVVSGNAPDPASTLQPWILVRGADGGDGGWLRAHAAGDDAIEDASQPPDTARHFEVPITLDGTVAGAIHSTRAAGEPEPGRGARRILVLAADQLGAAARRDRLQADLTATEVARQGEALRGAILDSVSHDLRTPVASIRALAGGLADAATDPDPRQARATAAAIDGEAARLADLVNDLLDMGRVQAGAVQADVRPYDLAELVETAVRHRAGGAGRHVTVTMPDDLPPVLADAVLFDVALGNAVINALEHTTPGVPIEVSAAAFGDRLEVAVDDGGVGVPDEALPHLFERFYRVRVPGEPARRGVGMGLAIAQGFVLAMGGTIAASRSARGGLRIVIGLPAAAERLP